MAVYQLVASGAAAQGMDLVLGEFVAEFPPSGSGVLVFKSGKKRNAGLCQESVFFTLIFRTFSFDFTLLFPAQ